MPGLRWTEEVWQAWKERELTRYKPAGDVGQAEAIAAQLGQAPHTADRHLQESLDVFHKLYIEPAKKALEAASARIILPWPPSGNHGTRHAGGAHYLTREHVDYRAKVLELVNGLKQRAPLGRLRVTAHFAVPDKRRRDLDNVWKVASDALQHAGLIWDDSAIDELHLYRTPVVKGGEVNVLIESLA